MPICQQTQKQIPDFLNDLLSEADRHAVRGHLEDCARCRGYVSGQVHWAADLKSLNAREIPFDLSAAIQESFVRRAEHSAEPHFKKKFFWKGFFAGAGLVAAAVFLLARSGRDISPRRLPIKTAPAVSGPALQEPEKQNLNAPRVIENLHPLRWNLAFASKAEREEFQRQVRQKTWKSEFSSSEVLVLSLQRAELAELVSLIRAKMKTAPKGLFQTKDIPVFIHPVRVALMMPAPGDPTRVLHLKFALPNIFVLQKQIESAKINFVYTSSELWILEMASRDYGRLKSLVLDMPGLTAWEEPASSAPAEQKKWRVLVTLDS